MREYPTADFQGVSLDKFGLSILRSSGNVSKGLLNSGCNWKRGLYSEKSVQRAPFCLPIGGDFGDTGLLATEPAGKVFRRKRDRLICSGSYLSHNLYMFDAYDTPVLCYVVANLHYFCVHLP